jgi:trans-aconitate methyltransferase
MRPKPDHLGPEYAAQFADRSVAREYHTRPPYPAELFTRLLRLLPAGERTVLDLGCGTGEVAVGLVGRVDRIDAVDPSAAMLEVASTRHPSETDGLRWVQASAERFRPTVRYGLIVAAESLHWMDWEVVFGWLPDALVHGGALALVSGREFVGVPWHTELAQLIPRFSTNRRYKPYDLAAELAARGLFEETGRYSTRPIDYAQSLEAYVQSFHTRNGFSRERMSAAAAASFDAAVIEVAKRYCPDGWVRGQTAATVVWGVPRRPTTGRS